MPRPRARESSRVAWTSALLSALALCALGVAACARCARAGEPLERVTDRTQALVAGVAGLPGGAVMPAVNLYSGNLLLEVSLFRAPALGPDSDFALFHNSRLAAETGPLGPGWRHSAMISLLLGVPASNTITVRWADGRRDVLSRHTITPVWSSDTALEGLRILLSGGVYQLSTKHRDTYNFDGSGRLVSLVDRLGHGFAYAYDGSGQLVSQTDDAARSLQFHYDGSGRLVRVDGLPPVPVQFTYDGLGRLASTDALGQPIDFGPLADGRVADVRFESQEFAIDYFPTAPAVVRTVRSPGARRDFIYDGDSLKTVVRDSLDASTHYDVAYTFDARGRVVRVDAGPLGVSQCVYGAFNRALDYTAADGSHWLYQYDSHGNLARFEDPTGAVQQFTWDPTYSLLTSTLDAAGGTWNYDRFADGNLQKRTDPLGNFEQYAYDASGRLATYTDPLGHATTFGYDANSDVSSVTDPLLYSRTFTYDARGNLLTATDEEGNTWTYARDALDRVVSCTPPESLGVTTYTYTPRGLPATVTDPLGSVTRYTYDPLDRIASAQQPDGGTWQFARDGAGRVRTLTDPAGSPTQYQYDAPGRLIRRIDPIGATDEYQWSLHQLEEHRDPLGQPHQFEYTPRGEKKKIVTPGGPSNTFQYDAPGRLIRAERVVPGDSTIAYDYAWDAAHRLVQSTQSPFGRVTNYVHDAAGDLIQVSDNLDPNVTTYTYDDRRQLASLTAGAAGTVTLAHTPRGLPSLLQYPGGTSSAFEYDAAGQLEVQTNLSPSLFARYQVTYDARGGPRRVASTTPAAGSRDVDYAQDPSRRLTDEHHVFTGEVTHWTYDFSGSRLSANAILYGYDPSHRLHSTSGGLTKTWNDAGQVLEYILVGDTTRFQYRADGSLAGAVHGAQQWAFSQGPFGELVHVRYPDGSERWSAFDQDGSGPVRRATLSGIPGTWSDTYYSALDEQWLDITDLGVGKASPRPLGHVVAATPRGWRPLLYDATGNVAQYLNYDGGLKAERYYSAFGDVLASVGTTTTEPGFGGMETLPGLDEFRVVTVPEQYRAKLAVAVPLGTLVQPMTREQYQAGSRPNMVFHLYSHSDQTQQMTPRVYCPRTGLFLDRPLPDPGPAPAGYGGRVAAPSFRGSPIECGLFAPLGGSCTLPLPPLSGLLPRIVIDIFPFGGPQDGLGAPPPPPKDPPKKADVIPSPYFDPFDDPATLRRLQVEHWFRSYKPQWTEVKPYTWP